MKASRNPVLFVILIFISSFATSSPISENVEPTPATISPTLVFPVAHMKAFVGSFWGAARGGGKRKHEGIDIFSRKGTPVVAICDGIVVDVRTTPKGGKVVWLRSVDHSLTAYYAHLDQQKVKEGQFVKKGELVGTVGNTGNAKYTPAHLHFGIYTYKGAVNPLPYVKKSPKIAKPYRSVDPQEPILVNNYTTQTNSSFVNNYSSQTNSSIESTPEIEPFDQKQIWKSIDVPLDTTARYYVTTSKNVVRVQEEAMYVIGKWKQGPDKKYPYRIVLNTKEILLVNPKGKVLTSNGKIVGFTSL